MLNTVKLAIHLATTTLSFREQKLLIIFSPEGSHAHYFLSPLLFV